jgi:drug/metabolite transporter (DMT)-like permease
MIGRGLASGERLTGLRLAGFVLALGGLVSLLLPGLAAPPLLGSALMIGAGVAWGVYSLRGRGAGDPTRVTSGNFVRAVPFGLALSLLMLGAATFDAAGVAYAVASGAITSGL